MMEGLSENGFLRKNLFFSFSHTYKKYVGAKKGPCLFENGLKEDYAEMARKSHQNGIKGLLGIS